MVLVLTRLGASDAAAPPGGDGPAGPGSGSGDSVVSVDSAERAGLPRRRGVSVSCVRSGPGPGTRTRTRTSVCVQVR